MATYKEIHGVQVQYRDSDPTAVEAAQAAWDDLSDEAKAASTGRPGAVTIP